MYNNQYGFIERMKPMSQAVLRYSLVCSTLLLLGCYTTTPEQIKIYTSIQKKQKPSVFDYPEGFQAILERPYQKAPPESIQVYFQKN